MDLRFEIGSKIQIYEMYQHFRCQHSGLATYRWFLNQLKRKRSRYKVFDAAFASRFAQFLHETAAACATLQCTAPLNVAETLTGLAPVHPRLQITREAAIIPPVCLHHLTCPRPCDRTIRQPLRLTSELTALKMLFVR
jgi:hypothetical protein